MTEKEFILWIEGYLEANLNRGLSLDTESIKVILDKLKHISPPLNIGVIYPNYNYLSDKCKYPEDCGLPSIWYGIEPPTCNKCGYSPKKLEIT